MFIVKSLCGKHEKIFYDYNKAVIEVNNPKSVFYLGVILK